MTCVCLVVSGPSPRAPSWWRTRQGMTALTKRSRPSKKAESGEATKNAHAKPPSNVFLTWMAVLSFFILGVGLSIAVAFGGS